MQPRGDLLVPVAARDQLQHLALTSGELVELGICNRVAGAKSVEHESGEPRREHCVAVRGAVHRLGELVPGDRLRHVSARARADDADHVLSGIRHGEREELHTGPLRRDLHDHGLATAVGQVHVEQHDIGVELLDQRHRLEHGARLADHLDRRTEPRAHAGTEKIVVVDEHDAAQRPAHRVTSSSTSVPSPGAETILAVPPTRSILPRIDSATPRRSAATASGSKPAPRSRT